MDCDHVWTNSAGNLTPMYSNSNCSFTPLAYREPLCNVRSGSNSLVNLPCCSSPGCSGFVSFSPEPYVLNVKNQNVRHHPYQPHLPPKAADYRPHESLPFHSVNGPYRSQMNEACFPPQINWQGNVGIHPNLGKEESFRKTYKAKPNVGRRRQKNSSTQKVIPNLNPNFQPNHNNHQINYDGNIELNCILKNDYLVSNNNVNRWGESTMPNKQGYETIESYVHKEDKNNVRVNNNITHISMNNINETEGINALPYTVKDTDLFSQHNVLLNTSCNVNVPDETSMFPSEANSTNFVPEHKNDQHSNTLNCEQNNINSNLVLGDEITNTQMNNCQSVSNIGLSECQVKHVTMPENSIFNVQDMQEKGKENTDMESFFFEPIFEGKDENGEDIVILLANSNTQQVPNEENNTGTLVYNQCIETQHNPQILNNLTENVAISNESTLEPRIQEVPNEQNGNLIFSHIDDYGSEEVVTTTKRKCPKTKVFNKNVKNTNEENVTVNQPTGENYATSYFQNIPSTSRERRNIATYTVENVNRSHTIYKRKTSRFRQRMPAWKRRLTWKSNDPLRNLKRKYLNLFLRRVRLENEHMSISGNFWNMYRIIVNQIGGNVLQTMYNILPALNRNFETYGQRSNRSSSNQSKKRLQVKFPPKNKK